MRDVVTLFVEASLSKGEWLAALRALQLPALPSPPPADKVRDSSSDYHLIARTLSTSGKWDAALCTLRAAPPHNTAYSAEYLRARIDVYHDVVRSYYDAQLAQREGTSAAVSLSSSLDVVSSPRALDGEEASTVLREVVSMATEAFHVTPPTPTAALAASDPASASPLPLPLSTEGDACGASAAALLEWCQAQLRDASESPALTEAQRESMMQALRGAADVAQRGVVRSTAAPSNSSKTGHTTTATTATREAPATVQDPVRVNSEPPSTVSPSPPPLSPAAEKTAEELRAILQRQHPAREDWARALDLLTHLPASSLTPHMFTALTRLLANRRRSGEFERLVQAYVLPADPVFSADTPALKLAGAPTLATATVLAADAVVLKSIAEACRRLRCPQLAKELLSRPPIRAHLTPSAAVPLVMVLRDAEAYALVVDWWAALRKGEETVRYPLLQHAKLSSYVASCVLRRARDEDNKHNAAAAADKPGGGQEATVTTVGWIEALRAFEHAEGNPAADPALVLLFELRLVRQVRQWEAAIRLFSKFAAQHPMSATAPLQKGRRGGDGRARPHNAPATSHRASSTRHQPAESSTPTSESPTVLESVFAILTEERVEQWVPQQPREQLRQQVEQYRRAAK